MSKHSLTKRILKAPRDRFLSSVVRKIEELDGSVKDLRAAQGAIEHMQHEISQNLARTGGTRVFQISPTSILVKIFSGAKMYLDPRDVAVVPHLVLDGEWEGNITKAWLSVLKQGGTIVDIGANFGYFGVLASQYTHRDSKVIYFEANPNLIPYISKTLDVNSFDECSVIENAAVSDKPGKLVLRILKGYIASSSLHTIKDINKFNKNHMEVSDEVSVKSLSLDDYCKTNDIKSLDLIKMDIEGFEDKAYKGMRDIVKSSPNLIMFVEFTAEAYEDPQRFFDDMLADFGHVYLISDSGELIQPSKIDYENIIQKSEKWVMPVFSKKKLEPAQSGD